MGSVRRTAMAMLLLVGLTGLMPAGLHRTANAQSGAKRDDAPLSKGEIGFGGKPVRIEIRPRDSFLPVRTTQIYLVTVYDDRSQPVRRSKVEWAIEGPGEVVASADDTKGNPKNNGSVRFLTGITCAAENTKTVDGNTFVVRPGQSWIAIRSGVEGQTKISVDSPEMDKDAPRKQVQTIWVDAKWKLPAPLSARIGTEAVIKAQVVRMNDDQPLQGYLIRYRIEEGPSAQWIGSSYKTTPDEGIATTDSTGVATIRLSQSSANTGVNQISIAIARPDPASKTNIVLGKGKTTVSWQAPELSATLTAPKSAPLNEDFVATLAITNNGPVESQGIFARLNLPPGVQITSSTERATRDGNEILWSLPSVPPGKQATMQLKLRGSQQGPIRPAISMRSADEQSLDAFADVIVCKPALQVQLKGPQSAVLDETLPFELSIRNAGNGPAEGVEWNLQADAGLTPVNGPGSLKQVIESLPAGETKVLTIPMRADKPGSFGVKASAQGAGSPFTPSEPLTVVVGNPQLMVSVKGPERAFVDQPVEWTIRVENPSDVELTNVTLRAILPPDIKFQKADREGRFANDVVEWNLGTAPKKQSLKVRVGGICTAVNSRARLSASVSADPLVKREGVYRTASLSKAIRAEATSSNSLEVLGIPALHMEVSDTADPIQVGSRTTYVVRVRNTGSLAASQVAVTGELSSNLKPGAAMGQGAGERGEVSGRKIVFPVRDTLKPGEEMVLRIEAESTAAGEGRFRAELRSHAQSRPIVVEEATSMRPGSIVNGTDVRR